MNKRKYKYICVIIYEDKNDVLEVNAINKFEAKKLLINILNSLGISNKNNTFKIKILKKQNIH